MALQSFVSAAETQRQTELLQARRDEVEVKYAEWEELTQAVEANA
jgi:hypothetical protein